MIKFLLGTFFANSAGAIAKRVLIALGFGIISTAAVTVAFNAVLNYAHSQYSGLTGYVAAFLGIGGIGDALGIITGALAFRVAMQLTSKLGVIPK